MACSNKSRTRDAPTPTNISTKSEPLIEKNGTPASPETAFARRVFPVPGGPTRRTPFGILAPSSTNLRGSLRNSTISIRSSFSSSAPATSSNLTFIFSSDAIRALLLPNDITRLPPPPCDCCIKKTQKRINSTTTTSVGSIVSHHGAFASGGKFTSERRPSSIALSINCVMCSVDKKLVLYVTFSLNSPDGLFKITWASKPWTWMLLMFPESNSRLNSLYFIVIGLLKSLHIAIIINIIINKMI